MKLFSPILAAVLLGVPASAQVAPPPQLSLEHRMLLRCSAAFALVAYRQDTGDASAQQYPPLKQRGSEFFVRASAQVMDEAKLDRTAIGEALKAEAQTLLQGGTLAAIMPVCLSALEASEQ
jgi:hypothetical protein